MRKSITTVLGLILLTLSFGTGCGSRITQERKFFALRQYEIVNGTSIRFDSVEQAYAFTKIQNVEVSDSRPNLGGTYIEAISARFSPLWYDERVTIYVRTKEQKEEWEKCFREIIYPRDITPACQRPQTSKVNLPQ